MALVVYHTLTFLFLFSYAHYHLISATLSFLKPSAFHAGPSSSVPARGGAYEHVARLYHPLLLAAHRHHLLRHLPLYLTILSLLLGVVHHIFLSVAARPASYSVAVHRFVSLESAAAILFFFLLAASLLLSNPLSPELLFFLAALGFALISAASSHSAAVYPPFDLQAKCDAVYSLIYAASSALALALALNPRLFVAELALAASVALQGLWSLQTGLSLYVEAFIPEGCHRFPDLPENTSTRCDLESSRVRAAALMDLAFVLHAAFSAIVAVVVYGAVALAVGSTVLVRKHNGGSYEAPSTSSSTGTLTELVHVQMNTMSKNTAQD